MDVERAAEELTGRKVVRRGLLAGIAALGAAAAMKVTGGARKAEAVDGQFVLIGSDVQTAQTPTLLIAAPAYDDSVFNAMNGVASPYSGVRNAIIGAVGGNTNSSGVFGVNESAGITAFGVVGRGDSGGVGVFGRTSNLHGVMGQATVTAGLGVRAVNTADGIALKAVSNTGGNLTADGNGSGVAIDARSTGGFAIQGTSALNNAIVGFATATATAGVYGETPSAFTSSYGVRGVASVGRGVQGEATNFAGIGVRGVNSVDGTGLKGVSNTGGNLVTNGDGAGIGVEGRSGSGPGVRGQSVSAAGVFGQSFSQPGVEGVSTNSLGIRGTSTNFVGIVGISTGNHGLYGSTNAGAGVYGIVAENLGANGPGLLITGAAPSQVFGGLQVFGVKNAVIKMQDGTFASVYCQESPEPYFEDFGRAQLAGGVASVPLEREFSQLVAGGDYMVTLTPEGASNHLFVSRRTPTGFEVREGNNGLGNVSFTYRIVTKRKDIEGRRFARVSTEAAEKVAGARAMLSSMGTPGSPSPTRPGPAPFIPPANPVAPMPPVTNQQAPNPPLPNPTQPGPTQNGTTGIGGVR